MFPITFIVVFHEGETCFEVFYSCFKAGCRHLGNLNETFMKDTSVQKQQRVFNGISFILFLKD